MTVVEGIGLYHLSKEAQDLDCTKGDLAMAYERGWNAAIQEALGRLSKARGKQGADDE